MQLALQPVTFNLRKLIGQLLHKPACYWLGHDEAKLTQQGAPNLYRNWRRCKRCGLYSGDQCV
jgi:hypothetical protein